MSPGFKTIYECVSAQSSPTALRCFAGSVSNTHFQYSSLKSLLFHMTSHKPRICKATLNLSCNISLESTDSASLIRTNRITTQEEIVTGLQLQTNFKLYKGRKKLNDCNSPRKPNPGLHTLWNDTAQCLLAIYYYLLITKKAF